MANKKIVVKWWKELLQLKHQCQNSSNKKTNENFDYHFSPIKNSKPKI